MTKTLGLAAAVVALSLSAHAVEVEGPSPSQAPTAPLTPVVPAATSIPNLGPITTPVNLDLESLPSKGASLSPSAQAAANAPTASAPAVPAAKTIPAPVGTVDNPFRPQAAAAKAQSPRAKTSATIANISEHVAKAAETASKSDATSETGASAGGRIQRELTGEKEAPSDYVSVYLSGVEDGSIPTGPRLSPSGKPGEYRARTVYTYPYGVREEFVNPGHVYNEAYYAASLLAKRMGLSPSGRVFFAEVTGSLPLTDGAHAKFSFVPAGPQAKPAVIYVDFSRNPTTKPGEFDVRATAFAGVGNDKPVWPDFDDPAGYNYISRGFERGPQAAYEEARRKVPGFAAKGGASFSAALQKDEKTGDVDVWYKLYDDAGAVVGVNARTLEARAEKKPAPPKPPVDWATVLRHSGPFALLGLAAFAAWFTLVLALTRDLAWAAKMIWPIGALVSTIVGADLWSNALRYRKK